LLEERLVNFIKVYFSSIFMGSNFNFDLSSMPPAGWVTLIAVVTMLIGKLFELDFLFFLGLFLLVVLIIVLIIYMIGSLIPR
jgi:hypothetical protein